jgi:tartrate-resistant acid phosphatase type 5
VAFRSCIALLAVPAALWAQADAGRVFPAEPLHLVAFGDFGTGEPPQREVAQAIARRHAAAPYHLGITLGDNFYHCGVRGVNDPLWMERWENLYSGLGVRFYATLGNHDYAASRFACLFRRGSAQAQVDYSAHSPSWRMPARYYTFTAGAARFVALDTEKWSAEQLAWVERTLQQSAGEPGVAWRIVYGHHPVLTSGEHRGDSGVARLRRDLLPLLRRAGVDLYIAGHDHHLEHLRAEGVELLIAGGGGAKLRPANGMQPESVFAASGYGFLDLVITEHMLTAQFYDRSLTPLEPAPLLMVK